MTGSGDTLPRNGKTRFALFERAPWLLVLCLLPALEPFERAEPLTNSTSAASADWSPDNFGGSNAVAQAAVNPNFPPPEIVSPAVDTNLPPAAVAGGQAGANSFNASLAMARYLENMRQPEKAEPILVGLLADTVPSAIQKSALLELGVVVREENDLPRAQNIYAQFLNRWPNDVKIPEVLLRQGEIFRQMGLNDLALGKFYSVMASALSLKNDQLAYYERLVLQTQVEIADTHYLMGRFADAADFYSRLLKKNDPGLNHPQIQFRLIRSLAIIGRNDQAVGQAQDFLSRFPGSDQEPEVRYYLAEALKALGRNNEALRQVLLCLQEQKAKTQNDPEIWAYWQQRVGNEIGNQLYREGDYVSALEVYINLAQLDSSPQWQVPVDYQMGMTYEKLLQPQKAIDAYKQILDRETEVGTNATPGLKAVFDMARWRVGFIQWQTNADAVDHSLAVAASAKNSITKPASKNE